MNSLGLELFRNCPHTTHFFYICCGCWGNDFGLLAVILSQFLWFMHAFPFSSKFYCFFILCPSLSSKAGGNRAPGDVPDWCFVQPCYIRGVTQQVNNQRLWRMRKQSYRFCEIDSWKAWMLLVCEIKVFFVEKRKSNSLCDMRRFWKWWVDHREGAESSFLLKEPLCLFYKLSLV